MALQILKELYLFKNLDDAELAPIEDKAMLCDYEKGQRVFNEGDPSTSLFIVQSGAVEMRQQIASGEDLLIITLSAGSHFGELGYFDRQERSTHAVCLKDSRLIQVEYDDLKRVCEHSPLTAAKVYHAFAQFLAARLRMTTKKLSNSKEASWLIF